MHDFLLKNLYTEDIEQELKNIGYDSSYIFQAKNKFIYKNFKIYDLTCAQANIIKQLALSVGADCATNKDVITGKADFSNCILGGSVSQLYKIAQKLQMQPFGLKNLSSIIKEKLEYSDAAKTKIIGILNLTQNSFSDGGMYYRYDDAVSHLEKLINDGADIIDIGAESTKPGAKEVEALEQIEKIEPIMNYINKNNISVPISIDTRSAKVAQKCIELGASIINDVSGFDYDSEMINVIARNPQIKIIIQHSQGVPQTMQISPHYENLMDEIYFILDEKVSMAQDKGINKANIIIDPGIGFGKTKKDNYEIIKRWQELKTIGCPVLIGISRKSMIDIPNIDNDKKDLYTLALNSKLINENVDYIRVHNVSIHKNFLDLL